MRTPDIAPQRTGIDQQVHVTAAQPGHLATSQPRPRHQQHDQPVTCRPARREHGRDLLIRGPVHTALRLVQAMPRPQPICQARVLALRLHRQVTAIGQLVNLAEHPPRRLPGRHHEGQETPHRRKHTIDPTRAAHRRRSRTRHDHRRLDRHSRRRVLQPGHEQPHVFGRHAPVPTGPLTPSKEQRDPARMRPCRRFRPITTEPQLPKEPIRYRHDLQSLVQHRPVPNTGRQTHTKCPHRSPETAAHLQQRTTQLQPK